MKEGWELKKIQEVCTLVNGKAYKREELLSNGKYPVLRVGNLFTNNQWYYSNLELDKDKYCDNGDLIYAWSASFGPRIWNGGKVIYHYHIWKVIPDFNLLTRDYLYHLLEWDKELIKSTHGTGTTMMHVGKGSMEKRLIPIPPLSEQKQLVALLDRAFEKIEKSRQNIEQNIENAKELFQSKLNEIFSQPARPIGGKGDGWEEKTLEDIGEIQTGTTPPTKDKTNYGNHIPFAKPPHFNSDGSINTKDCMLSKKGLEKARLFKANSTLMVCIGATIGKTGFTEIPISSNQQINAITPNNNYVPKLIYYGLISPFVQKQVLSIGKSAQATLPIINKTKWSKLKVHLPKDKSTQSKIIETLQSLKENCMKTESTYQQKLFNLDELKKSLLQKAFAGELTGSVVEEELPMAAEPEEEYK